MYQMSSEERARHLRRVKALVEEGKSTVEIGRMLGRTPQAVHAYLQRHNRQTPRMREKQNDVDNVTAAGDKGVSQKETPQ